MPSRFPAGLRGQLAAFSFSRMILNTGFRMVYPFLPAIARGLGLDLATAALAVTARSATGLASPLLGFLADDKKAEYIKALNRECEDFMKSLKEGQF